jgi:hypothetical protein
LPRINFGSRDQSYTILGVEFETTGPRLWYPGDRRHVIVQLNSHCANDWLEAQFELAHECVHLLSPTGKNDANVLEEGLATFFSLLYIRQNLGRPYHITDPRYVAAADAVERLLTFVEKAIVELRKREAIISKITAEQITERYATIGQELAAELASRF